MHGVEFNTLLLGKTKCTHTQTHTPRTLNLRMVGERLPFLTTVKGDEILCPFWTVSYLTVSGISYIFT